MSITNRTVFFDTTGNYIRFWDWALVTTSIGTMAEPFVPNDRIDAGNITNFDPTDEMSLITSLHAATVDRQAQILSGGVDALHGGYQMPRQGR